MANLLTDLVSQSAGRALSRTSLAASSPASSVVRPALASAAGGSSRRFEEALQRIDVLEPASGPIAPIVPGLTPPREAAAPGPGSDAAQAAAAGREEAQAGLAPGALLISGMASGDAGTAVASMNPVPGDGTHGPTTRTNVPDVTQAGDADAPASAAPGVDLGESGSFFSYGTWGYPATGTGGILAAGGASLAEPRAAAEPAATPRAAGVPHVPVGHAGLATTLAAAGAAGMRMHRGGEASTVVWKTGATGIVNSLVNSLESGAGPDRGLAAMASQAYGVAATLVPAQFAAAPADGVTPAAAGAVTGEHPLATLLGERLHYQIARRAQHAVLRLDPPSMGSIEILIRNEGGSLHVHLRASNAEVARQLQGIGDSLRQDLAQRQQGEVSVQIDDGARDPDGRQRQRHAQAWQQAPGRGLNDMGDEPRAAAFSMNTEAR